MVDCQNVNYSSSAFETPTWGYHKSILINPYDSMPQTPQKATRVLSQDVTKRVLADLNSLSVPTMLNHNEKIKPITFRTHNNSTTSSSPLFHNALKRMRDGKALKRLKDERDAVGSSNLTTEQTAIEDTTKSLDAMEEEAKHRERVRKFMKSSSEKDSNNGNDMKASTSSSSIISLGRNVQRRNSGAALSA